ncbi:universal stress protein [Desulforamulus putei]|uniref:Universal stress protein family protein n=1 Tax=Desulforamulus putei DSM 12395 TaxID=1121429 RepID=A0A1M4T4K1_9FIRM|nr:universal stress protein [Desulforamulus putei]SHE39419.1 Universal stress protein family protein [Desulforamulus putei DSM 12395]
MYKNILAAVHGEEDEGFLTKIAELVMLTKPHVTVLHVSETGLTHYGYVDQLASAITKEQFIQYIYHMADERQKDIYNKFRELSASAGIQFEWKLRQGNPSKEISQELNTGNYDLLILGTKPKSPGNTSSKVKEKILKGLTTSLLIIK